VISSYSLTVFQGRFAMSMGSDGEQRPRFEVRDEGNAPAYHGKCKDRTSSR
jgi:hypothetical protein